MIIFYLNAQNLSEFIDKTITCLMKGKISKKSLIKTGRIKGGKSGRVALELLTQPIGYDSPLLLPYLHEQDTNRNEVLKANIDKWLLDSAKGFESY